MPPARSRVSLLALALVASCGKTTKEPGAAHAGEANAASAGSPSSAAAGNAPVKAPSRGPERVALSLVDARLSGHLTRGGGLLVPGGSAGFAKYVRFGNQTRSKSSKSWELRQTEGSVKVARMTGRTASVFVPLTAEQARRGTVRMRLHLAEAGALSVRINEDEGKELNRTVEAGWQTIELDAAGQLAAGENELQLFTRSDGVALAWLQVGGKTAVGEDGAATFYDRTQQALVIPEGDRMSWYVIVPERARLTGDLADGKCQIAVHATAEDGSSAEGKLVGLGSAVELASLAGKAARLELEATGCPNAALAKAALVVPGEAPKVKRGDAPKYVLFIIMDSLRADRVKVFDAKARADVPNWEQLARTSTLFTQHYPHGTESQVSHATMWTSMYLAKHRAAKMKDKIAARFVTIDEVAKQAGKYIAGVSANGYIRPTRGFGTAWNKFSNHIMEELGLRGRDVVEKGLSFIEPRKTQPWFLYLGLIDTHVTWRAKSPWIEKYDGGYKGRFEKAFGDDGNGPPQGMTEREIRHIRALYDSNISYQDDLLGKLIAKLKEWGTWDQTMLIITADHGDELFEDGKTFGHARSALETVIHVPMLIHYPPLFPAGKIASGTEGVDIVPTIADALGVAQDPEWQGASLIPLANGQHVYPQLAVATQYENHHAGRLGHWKLRISGGGTPDLYDLAKDPAEHHDLWGDKAAAIPARVLLDAMWMFRQWNREWKKSQWGNPAAVTSRFAADLGE